MHEVYRIVERDDDHGRETTRYGLTALTLSRASRNIESRVEGEVMRKEEVERETANRRREEERKAIERPHRSERAAENR